MGDLVLWDDDDLFAFLGDVGPALAWDARQRCAQEGRGAMIVGFELAESGRFIGRYAPLLELVAWGASDELVDAVRQYDVECEAVLFVPVVGTYRLLKISLERGPERGARPN